MLHFCTKRKFSDNFMTAKKLRWVTDPAMAPLSLLPYMYVPSASTRVTEAVEATRDIDCNKVMITTTKI